MTEPKTRGIGLVGERPRERMIQDQLLSRGIRDPRVIEVMRDLPRHLFVDEALAGRSYSDATLPIGEGQTLSQPYTVARMTEALELTGSEEVLEIGTGSGYQTAVLARLCAKVYTIERITGLAESARKRLRRLNFHNIFFRTGDGSLGWPEPRAFDRILVTAGAPVTPERLTAQLAANGIMIIPVGDMDEQQLLRIAKTRDKLTGKRLEACCFVPLVGEQGWKEG